jgi:alpha-amylase/alpha-mannosidase (GH57 family)
MHQPYYLDPETGESVLPWVRLHALKDYWGMVALLDQCPGMRLTVNLVPSLIEQVQAYAAEATWDRLLVTGLREAAALTPADAEWLVRESFHAHPPTMIEPYARYHELWRRHAAGLAFDVGAVRDLQVWQKLAWVDPDVAESDPRLLRLHAKGRDFDESDKATLRAVELELLRRIVPAYRAAAERGHVELSTSPYFHPILPLLCDSAAHHDAHPGAPLPDPVFRRPEDAETQLHRAVEAHTQWFGRAPRGVWPSEGSVSPATASAVARAGFSWMASDEDILRRSRAAAGLEAPDVVRFQPHAYQSEAGEVRLAFRDHGLSDAIGFTYQQWPTASAVEHFVSSVTAIGTHAARQGIRTPTVFVILDGENAWEHYPGGGRPFLRALYRALAAHPDVAPVTMSEALGGHAEPLPRLFSGSWIHADFAIWMGHADDRRAWGQIARARTTFDLSAPGLSDERRRTALDALLAAEGSDWFWWYGDDHSSAHDRDFDALFRRHLVRAWRAMGTEPPEELFHTNITTEVAGDDILRLWWSDDAPGTGFLRRLGARSLERPSGAMQRTSATVIGLCELAATPGGLSAVAATPTGVGATLEVQATGGEASWRSVPLVDGTARVPWSDLGAEGSVVRVRLVARDQAGRVVETVPADGLGRRVLMPPADRRTDIWTA